MSDMRLELTTVLLASASLCFSVRAQRSDSVRISTPVAPVARAARRVGAIAIDGSLDDSAWRAATPITGLRQYQPQEGAPASLPTEIRLLYDDEAIYIGARMSEPEGARGVRAPLARRDQLLDANGNNGSFNSLTTDKLVVVLDPYHNHRDEALFEVNPAGVRGDQLNGDQGWDPIWTAATKIDSLGWTAEMRIPYSQLRFSRDSVQLWGMQVWRYEDRLNEQDMWSFWRKSDAGGPAYFGSVEGIRIGERPRQLEILPYVLTGEQLQHADAGDPFHGSHDTRIRAGGDVKYLLTSNLTLDATFYPDFGQVEVDPATLNLSPFETFYDEKRPFFIAGSSAFDFGGMNCNFCSNTSSLSLFYSRRIGRLPELSDWVQGRSTFADAPDYTPIIGAAKITGRTNSGYTVGLLDAVTSSQTERYLTASSPAPLKQEVEPLSNYFVGRVQKELNNGNSAIGIALTSTTRRLDDTVLTDQLHNRAEAVGLDWSHAWHHHDYSWAGSAVISSVEGSAASIAATERSSAHYFQRPDRSESGGGLFDASYDTLATALRGYGFYTRLAKDGGNWRWELMANGRSPGFEVNDLAYLDRADYKWFNANISRVWTVPTSWYRSISTIVGEQRQYTYDGLETDEEPHAFYAMEFPNYWNLRTFWIYKPTLDDDRLTRGGPAVKHTGYNFEHFQVSTDARKRAVLDMTVEVAHGVDSPTRTLTLSPGIAFKPMASMFVQLSPTIQRDEDAAQYVTTVPDSTDVAFFGNRYVFGYIKTRTISLDTRVNWTFSPNLTLQLFVQPFIASGAYSSFREFAAPRSVTKLVYGEDIGTISRTAATPSAGASYTVDPDGAGPAAAFSFADPDFTTRSLRGSAVLRWEYRPGSTVYFVWTQQRTGSDAAGDFDFGSATSAIFRDKPINLFQIKVNYWIGR
jgi:hypothetical protein